ncbi:methylenetetrahydrofolate reductase (NAD(P)H) met13 [Mucor velutinosus]|uniref:Endonuclease n=1 Tax=Mucor velutinosus TaxID=708070 RepID=A0AAN7I2H0_9FUNG|nr:methylenetetrahydrofolate reductase (NAD(P)H) met13 [Mucor velutinosus]
MAIPLSHYFWLTGGFFIGMFFMYNVVPFRITNHHQSGNNLHIRQDPPNNVLKFGNPGPISDLFQRTAYTASFNRRDRIPHWVGEHLTAESLRRGQNVSRDKSRFTGDKAVPGLFRVYTNDYTNSGYDRGHMAPAGDAVSSQTAMDETFLLTNIAPQVGPGFNRQYWAYLEQFCRDLTKNFTDVYVYSGPLFLPQLVTTHASSSSEAYALADSKIEFDEDGAIKVISKVSNTKDRYRMQYDMIGANGPTIAVPTHYFKILLVSNGTDYASGAFVLPNQAIDHAIPLDRFLVDLRAIEKASGLTFFQSLDRTTFTKLCDLVRCIV